MTKQQNARRTRGRGTKRNKPAGNGAGRSEYRGKGNPKQQLDKYKSMARDAMQSGDRVLAETYFQYADHYQRVLNERSGIASGVYEEPDEALNAAESDESDGEDESAPKPRRRRSRNQRAGNASAGEDDQPALADDPRRQSRADANDEQPEPADEGGETANGETAADPRRDRRSTRSTRTRRQRTAASSSGDSAGEGDGAEDRSQSSDSDETATDTAAE